MKGRFYNPGPIASLPQHPKLRTNLPLQVSKNSQITIYNLNIAPNQSKSQVHIHQKLPAIDHSKRSPDILKCSKTMLNGKEISQSNKYLINDSHSSTLTHYNKDLLQKSNISPKIREEKCLSDKTDLETSNLKQAKLKFLELSKKLKKFELDLPKIHTENFVITKFSLPKVLMKNYKYIVQRKKFKNSKVDEFFDRFEKDPGHWPYPTHKIGVNGWKLTSLKR